MNNAINHVRLRTPRDQTNAILLDVARERGLTVPDLMAATTQVAAKARYEAIRRLLEAKQHWTIRDAAAVFDMHHATVLYGLDRIGAGRLGRARNSTRIKRYEMLAHPQPEGAAAHGEA